MGGKIIDRLMRRKYISSGELAESSLKRTLTTLDLTALGIGSTLGVGVYVLAGDVAKNSAGPSVVLSFAIAAIASVFAGLCYAEFGARVPRAGSAYVYSYVCVGELIAFIIGWNLILEYVIGTASVARGYSNYLDSLFDKKMQSAFRNITPIHDWLDSPTASEYLSSYFDFFALGICILLSLLLSFGVKESSKFNNVFTVLNLLVVVYVIIIGSFKADIKNWQIEPEEVENSGNYNVGDGGFFPFGINGMLSGAATCFYGFIGFDAVATTGEETKNPQRSIPIAIVVSLTFIFLAYFGISTVLTMMWPYYDQDPNSPLPTVFEAIGWPSAKWIVSIGALFGLSTSLLGAMFPLPRVVYAMAKDGLIFRFLAKVHSKYQTPMLATLLSGTFGGILAAIFDLNALVDMMSIGTLLAYTLVAVCVLILRYSDQNLPDLGYDYPNVDEKPRLLESLGLSESPFKDPSKFDVFLSEDEIKYKERGVFRAWRNFMKWYEMEGSTSARKADSTFEDSRLISANGPFTKSEIFKQFFNSTGLCFIGVNALLIFQEDSITGKSDAKWPIVFLVIFIFLSLLMLFAIFRQPMSPQKLNFKVPLVPFLPALSMWINIYLMMKLSDKTWIRFSVWMTLGLLVYIFYGMWHSTEAKKSDDIESKARETFRDTYILDGIENGGFVADAKPEEPKKLESINVGVINYEENEDREVTSIFRPPEKSAVALQVQPKQRHNKALNQQLKNKLIQLPEIKVIGATPPREVMAGRGQKKRKSVVDLGEGWSERADGSEETVDVDDLHQHIVDCINGDGNEDQRGQELAQKTLDAMEDEDEGELIETNLGSITESSGGGSSISSDEAEALSQWTSGIHSRISGSFEDPELEPGNSDSGFESQLLSLHSTIDQSINDPNFDSAARNKKLSDQFLAALEQHIQPIKEEKSAVKIPVAAPRISKDRNRVISPIQDQYKLANQHGLVLLHFDGKKISPFLGSDVEVMADKESSQQGPTDLEELVEAIQTCLDEGLNTSIGALRGKTIALIQMRRDFDALQDPEFSKKTETVVAAVDPPNNPSLPPDFLQKLSETVLRSHERIVQSQSGDVVFENADEAMKTGNGLPHETPASRLEDGPHDSKLEKTSPKYVTSVQIVKDEEPTKNPPVAPSAVSPPEVNQALKSAATKALEKTTGVFKKKPREEQIKPTSFKTPPPKKYPLERNASFDVIAPGTQDSPLARKVDSKFTVIPLSKENHKEEDDKSSSGSSSSSSSSSEEEDDEMPKRQSLLAIKAALHGGKLPPPPPPPPPPPQQFPPPTQGAAVTLSKSPVRSASASKPGFTPPSAEDLLERKKGLARAPVRPKSFSIKIDLANKKPEPEPAKLAPIVDEDNRQQEPKQQKFSDLISRFQK